MDIGPIINIADDQNAVTIKSASYTSSGLLLLFYIIIETLPSFSIGSENTASIRCL